MSAHSHGCSIPVVVAAPPYIIWEVRIVSGAAVSTGFFFLCFCGFCAWFGLNGRVRGGGRSKWWGEYFNASNTHIHFLVCKLHFNLCLRTPFHRCPRDANRPPSTRRSRKQGLLPHQCCSCASKGVTRRRWVFRVSSECDHSSRSGARRTVVPWRGKCLVLWQLVCVGV